MILAGLPRCPTGPGLPVGPLAPCKTNEQPNEHLTSDTYCDTLVTFGAASALVLARRVRFSISQSLSLCLTN